MAELSGSPWRGAARASVFVTATPANNHQAWVSFDVNATAPAGDQSTWTGAPGTSLTLRFRWVSNGTGSGQQAPTFATVQARLPGGAQIGTDWTVAFPAAATEVTQTFHFDDDPTNGTLGTNREGMVELYLNWGSTGGALPWSQDSRGTTSGIIATNTAEWARGKARAPVTLSAFSISDASLGGAEPALFGGAVATFNRATLDSIWYRGAALLMKHRQSAADVRSSDADTPTDTAVQRNYTWNTSTSGVAAKGRVNKDYALSASAVDARLVLPSNVFGGTSSDLEYVWAASGHLSGWTVTDNSTLTAASRFTADPRMTFAQLLQLNDSTFGSPPLTKNNAAGQRQTSDLAFLASRVTNANSTKINSVVWTEKLWDTGNLISSEASPWKSRSSTSQAQGGENGWSDALMTWDAGLPGGAWSQKEIITTSDLVGTEANNTRALTLLSNNPNFAVLVGGGTNNGLTGALTHWKPGNSLILGGAILNTITKQYVTPDASPVPYIIIGQFNLATGQGLYLRASDLTFQLLSGATADSFAMSASPGDANVFLKTFTGAQTAAWAGYDLQYIVVLYSSGTPYTQRGTTQAFGSANPHSGYAIDPILLALGGKLGTR